MYDLALSSSYLDPLESCTTLCLALVGRTGHL
jgi:hypothetical protein